MLIVNKNIISILCLLSGMLVFSCAEAFTKFLTKSYSPYEMMFFRSIFISSGLFILTALRRNIQKLKTEKYKLQILRSVFSAGSFLCATKALSGLQLYSYKSIYFLSPIFTASLGVLMLKEKITKWHILAFIFCLVGIFTAFKPGNDIVSQFGLFAIGASMCSSLAILVFKRMSTTESTESIIFYYSICSICISSALIDFRSLNVNFSDLYLFMLQAVLHLIASFLYTHGLRSQKISTIAVINYCTLPMSILLGWMIWKDFPTIEILFASFLIIVGNIALIYNQHKSSILERDRKK